MKVPLSLTDVPWDTFSFPDIFRIEAGYYNKKPVSSGKGTIPFLSATKENNGITEFYTLQEIADHSATGTTPNHPLEDKLFDGNCIAVTNNGSVGYAYYQKTQFTCSHDVNPLYLKEGTLNKDIARFIIVAIQKQRVCFEYSRKWRPARMQTSQLMLPIDADGRPNLPFMEAYIRQEQQPSLHKVISYYTKTNKSLSQEIDTLEDVPWERFRFSQIFREIKRGRRLVKAHQTKGTTPYISSTKSNNGVDGFIGNTNKVARFKHNLTIANSGSVGSCFYHAYEYIASDHVTALTAHQADKYVYLFMATIIARLEEKYSFNREINNARLQREYMILPVDKQGQPNWEYMGKVMRALEGKQLDAVLRHLQAQL